MVRTLVPLTARFPGKFGNLHDEMENLLDFAFRGESGRPGSTSWAPSTNVSETETNYEISVELPGIAPDDVTVEVHDGQLSISGSVEHEAKTEGKVFHRTERRTGTFRRVISVPDEVDAENIDADFEHGVLTVLLPKAEKAKPKRIDVKIK